MKDKENKQAFYHETNHFPADDPDAGDSLNHSENHSAKFYTNDEKTAEAYQSTDPFKSSENEAAAAKFKEQIMKKQEKEIEGDKYILEM